MITGTDHLVVLVEDIDTAISNYENMGLTLSHRATVDAVAIEQAFFRLNNGGFIELIAPRENSPLTKTLAQQGEGIHAVALQVTDIDQTVEQMESRGVTIRGKGTDQVFIHPKSANGVLFQLWDEQRPHRWQQPLSESE